MKKLLSFLLAGLVSAPVAFSSVVAYSPPVGGNTITLTGAVGGVPKVSTFSPALRLTVASSFVGRARGTFTAVTNTVFTDSSAAWTAGALSQAATPYFIRIRSGSSAGTWWQISTSTANTSSAVTIINRGQSPTVLGIMPGDEYEIVPADTLATFFGDVAPSIGGLSAATADAVRLYDGTAWKEYFYKTSDSKWHEGVIPPDRSNTIIRPDSGIVFIRKGVGNVSLHMVGAISDRNESFLVNATGISVIGSVFPVARTLGSLNIQTMPGFVQNTGSLVAADKVTVFDGTAWKVFHYNASASQWREGPIPVNRGTYSLPFGAPVIIERGSGASGSPVFLNLVIPYSI